MAVSFTRNLKLRIDSNLTANAKYNLEKIDSLGAIFNVDTTEQNLFRSKGNILLEPESADIGGSGVGGTLSIGTASHILDSLLIYVNSMILSNNLGLADQGAGGNKDLLIRYKSDVTGVTDTTADRTLSIDMEGADRNLVLGGSLSQLGGNLSWTLSGNTSLILPITGTLASLAGSEVLTNKTINAASNTIVGITNSNISSIAAISRAKIASDTPNTVVVNDSSGNLSSTASLPTSLGGTGNSGSAIYPTSGTVATDSNSLTLTNKSISGSSNSLSNIGYSSLILSGSIVDADISSSAAITYPKLSLSNSIVDADISSSAAIQGSKISPNFGNQLIRTQNKLEFLKGGFKTTIGPASSGQSSDIEFFLPPDLGNVGQVLTTNGSGDLSWTTVSGGGGGSVTQATGTWTPGDGTTKTFTHGMGTTNVEVQVIDNTSEIIYVSSIVVTDNNNVTLTSSEAPAGNWKIVVQGA